MKQDTGEEAKGAQATAQVEEVIRLPEEVPSPRIPFPIPAVSGLYEYVARPFPPRPVSLPIPETPPIPRPSLAPEQMALRPAEPVTEAMLDTREAWLFPIVREKLRLDVDGRYPQMEASGDVTVGFFSTVHWIAHLTLTGPGSYSGSIWYKDGSVASFPYTNVLVQVSGGWFPASRTATVTFTGGGAPQRVRTYGYKSAYFHDVDFEVDCQQGETAAMSVNTCAHPNRPATLACETLTIQQVFQRAGFNVTTSPGGPVPIAGAGPNAKWSNVEMHDAMQTYWSKYAAKAQWAMWIFFASLHEMGTSLGGIMFDDIGPQQRQGTAIFNASFISVPPAGDPSGAAFVARMLFWTACHETGHGFNLAHSWQKALVSGGKGPWIALANEPEARSFMNYPYNVAGGSTAFFADFDYRFSDQELLFLRHAPSRFVEQGDALWFDDHGFQAANSLPEPTFQLTVRVNRERPVFEFMEPVAVELKLTNATSQPQLVDEHILDLDQDITIVVKKDGTPARQLLPYAWDCLEPSGKVVMPGESMYAPLQPSVGKNGWDLATPGNYTVQACLHLPSGEDVVSNELRLRVGPPRDYEEEDLAQDYFTDEVGRVLVFEGSRFLKEANDTLSEIAERLPDRKVAVHANLVLGNALAQEHKSLTEDPKEPQRLRITVSPAKEEEAKQLLTAALTAQPEQAVESLGHIRFRDKVEQLSSWLAAEGALSEAYRQEDILLQTLSAREIRGRKVLNHVLEEIKEKRDEFKTKKS